MAWLVFAVDLFVNTNSRLAAMYDFSGNHGTHENANRTVSLMVDSFIK